MAQIRRLVA